MTIIPIILELTIIFVLGLCIAQGIAVFLLWFTNGRSRSPYYRLLYKIDSLCDRLSPSFVGDWRRNRPRVFGTLRCVGFLIWFNFGLWAFLFAIVGLGLVWFAVADELAKWIVSSVLLL